ncbi:hypothetical protein [Rhodococcus sp. 3A]|uniref:hypothetical protein n=1 Tax=Rhodococcus sp. 3A TaxID=2834581 RepID=UPI0037CA630D
MTRPGSTAPRQFAFTTRPCTAVDDATGEPIGLGDVDIRVGWQGHVAAARLAWHPRYPDGVYVPSWVTRVVTAQVVATLQTLAYRDTAITALSQRFDPATGRLTTPTSAADFVPAGFARGALRQLAAHARRIDGVPAGRLRITDVQGPPQTNATARLSAADRQLAQLAVAGGELVLTVKLPTSPTPAGRAQWPIPADDLKPRT